MIGARTALSSGFAMISGIELRQHLHHQGLGLHHARLHAFAHVDDRLVNPDDEAIETASQVCSRHGLEGWALLPEPSVGIDGEHCRPG